MPKKKATRAHKDNGTFQADDPKTPKNEAYGTQICDGPSTGYRDGPDGTIEVMDLPTGWLPGGWVDTPAKCKNDGDHVKVKPYDPADDSE